MILPSKAHPWRPIYAAVLLRAFFGLLFSGLSLLALGSLAASGRTVHKINYIEFAARTSTYLGIGVLYFLCAYKLNRLRSWAAIVSLSITSMLLLFMLAPLAVSIHAVWTEPIGERFLWFLFSAFWLFEFIVIAMIAVLIRALVRCFGAIETILNGTERGFEVIPVRREDEKSSDD